MLFRYDNDVTMYFRLVWIFLTMILVLSSLYSVAFVGLLF
jgi:hypothetical protein